MKCLRFVLLTSVTLCVVVENISNNTPARNEVNSTTKPKNDSIEISPVLLSPARNDVVNVTTKPKINLVAMIPFLMTRDKYCFHSAMRAALEYINKDDTILKDYELVIDYQDSTTLIGFSYIRFYSVMGRKDVTMQAMIGPAFSSITKAIASVATAHNLPQVTYAALTQLNDNAAKKRYPYFLRTTPSVISFNVARIQLLQHFKWKKVAILYDYSAKQFFRAATWLTDALKVHNIKAIAIQGFSNEISVSDHIDALKNIDARIIVGFFGRIGARKIFCEAYKKGFYGEKYQWILVHGLPNDWHEDVTYTDPNNCTQKHFLTAAAGYITVARSGFRKDQKLVFNRTKEEIWEHIKRNKREEWANYFVRTKQAVKKMPETAYYFESTYAFDAVYTVALGLNKSIPKQGLMTSYRDSKRATQMTEDMLSTSFEGLTGHLSFEAKTEERLGELVIRQFHPYNNYTEVELKEVGYSIVYQAVHFYDNVGGLTLFPNGVVTQDGILEVRITRVYSLWVMGVAWGLSSLGILLALFFLAINVRYRNVRLIKMSSPNINNGIIAGCITCYLSVFVYGLDSRFIAQEHIPIACNASLFIMLVGFTLSFGALFSKTWRIYKIFTAAKTMERVAIKDMHLYGLTILLMAIDVLIFIAWMYLSPFVLAEHQLETKKHGDTRQIFYTHICECVHRQPFFVTIYAYKGFLLVFGLFIAWETRHVKVAVLNDSKFIGMAVYNVGVISVVGVICATALYNVDAYISGYVVVSLCVFLCTTATLLLIFVPKIRLLFGEDIRYATVHYKKNQVSTKKSSLSTSVPPFDEQPNLAKKGAPKQPIVHRTMNFATGTTKF